MKKTRSEKYDTINSTYIFITVFESGQTMTGYSLKIGYTEPKDKETCLSNLFIRLLKQGYMRDGHFTTTTGHQIEKVSRIEFYYNQSNEEVYTFYPRFAEPSFEAGLSTRFIQKIEDLYQDLNRKMDFTDLYNKYYISRVRKKKEKYDLSAPRFYSRNALNEYAKTLIEDGEPQGMVQQYVNTYSNKFLDSNGRLDQRWITQIKTESNRAKHAKKVS